MKTKIKLVQIARNGEKIDHKCFDFFDMKLF